jgi:hypothetical protein
VYTSDPVVGLSDKGYIMTKAKGSEDTAVVTHDDVDVIIMATGYTVTDCGPNFEVTGTNGTSLTEAWKEGGNSLPNTLYGVSSPGFPNFFLMYGPNTNTILGSVTFFSECAGELIANLVKETLSRKTAVLTVKQEPCTVWRKKMTSDFEGRPEMDSCSAWYKGNGSTKGSAPSVPITNYPGGMLTYYWATKYWKKNDFVFSNGVAGENAKSK